MADQVKLCEVLKRIAFLTNLAKKNADHEATDGLVKVKYGQQWMGIDHCEWPRCKEGDIHQSSWIASRGDVSVQIWEMMFHYAQANHWISFTDIPEEDQAKLVEIFK